MGIREVAKAMQDAGLAPGTQSMGGYPVAPGVKNVADALTGLAAYPGDVMAQRATRSPYDVAPEAALALMGGGSAFPAIGNELRMGIKAYHGSPYDFEKFDTSKIGTGEGAQAYGHGLYFAENEGVAKAYRDALARSRFQTLTPEEEYATGLIKPALEAAYKEGGPQSAQELLDKYIVNSRRFVESQPGSGEDATLAALEKLKASGDYYPKDAATMYQVSINAHPDEFLDWDKPLSQQSETVQNVVRSLKGLEAPIYTWGVQRGSKGSVLLRSDAGPTTEWGRIEPTANGFYAYDAHGQPIGPAATEDAARELVVNKAPKVSTPELPNTSGQLAYYNIANSFEGKDVGASDRLRSMGIKGIRYADQGSRPFNADAQWAVTRSQQKLDQLKAAGAHPDVISEAEQALQEAKRGLGDITSNYVVFDDKTVEILKKYGLAGLIGGATLGPELARDVSRSMGQPEGTRTY